MPGLQEPNTILNWHFSKGFIFTHIQCFLTTFSSINQDVHYCYVVALKNHQHVDSIFQYRGRKEDEKHQGHYPSSAHGKSQVKNQQVVVPDGGIFLKV